MSRTSSKHARTHTRARVVLNSSRWRPFLEPFLILRAKLSYRSTDLSATTLENKYLSPPHPPPLPCPLPLVLIRGRKTNSPREDLAIFDNNRNNLASPLLPPRVKRESVESGAIKTSGNIPEWYDLRRKTVSETAPAKAFFFTLLSESERERDRSSSVKKTFVDPPPPPPPRVQTSRDIRGA